MALGFSSSVVECALEGRKLQATFEYVDPPWWDLISGDFEGINLRKCVRREFAPREGERCARKDRTCYFGNQDCPNVGPYPAQECFCDAPGDGVTRGIWSCIDQECPGEFWTPLGQTVIAGPGGSNFGERVALSADGLTLAASAKFDVDPSTGLEVGSVTAYRLIGDTWTQLGSTLFGILEDAEFGEDVDISADGSTLIVGADCDNDCEGSSYTSIFRFNGAEWDLVGERIQGGTLVGSGGEVDVTADGSIVVITAEQEALVGIFLIFDNSTMNVNAIGDVASTAFGSSVAISDDGSTIAIGAIEAQNSDGVNVGSVSIYGRIPNTAAGYAFVQTLEGFEVLEGDFGTSVALNSDGNILAVGDDRGGDFGEVRVYNLQNAVWTQLGQTLGGDAAADNFGDAVSLNAAGDILAVGADDGLGFVRVFSLIGDTWTPLGRQLSGQFENDEFGSEISLSATGLVLAVGVEGGDAVRVFRYA